MRKPDVVCFGEALWDLFEVSPRGTDAVGRVFRRELGGAEANVATGLARLGAKVALVAGVGQDRFGRALVDHLERDRVAVQYVRAAPKRTGMTFVVAGAGGQPEFLPCRVDTADQSLRADLLRPAMGRASWAVVGTSTLATEPLARATRRFLRLAAEGGARLLVDLNVRPHLWRDPERMRSAVAALVARASVVKASDADLRALGEKDEARARRWLERNAPRATWIVTRGPGEASATGEHGETRAAALPGRCVDATGAGDAFVAGALATLIAARAAPGSGAWRTPELWGWALYAGHVMARKAISRRGAVVGLVGLEEAERVLERARRRFA
jgi:fructokinase